MSDETTPGAGEPAHSGGLRLPKAAPDGLLASIFLAFLTTAGLYYVNIMAALVTGLIDGLGLERDVAGYVASANVYGAALGALAAVFAIKILPWRRTAYVALFGLMAIDLLSTTITDPDTLIAVRFVHGLTGGFLVGIGFSVIARTAVPDRSFGMLLFVQFGLGGVGLMFLPGMVPEFGHEVLFLALFAFSLVTLCMVPFLGDYPPRQSAITGGAQADGRRGVLVRPLAVALLSVFLFQAANMGIAAYVIELGRSAGLTTASVTYTLGIANWISMTGAGLVYVFGLRFGRTRPLMIGMVITLFGTALFHFSNINAAFIAVNIITGTAWAFLIPYLLGMCSEFDAEGQMAALSGFASKLGLATGPFIAALVVGDGNYGLIINLAIVGIGLSAIAAFSPARLLDKMLGSKDDADVEPGASTPSTV